MAASGARYRQPDIPDLHDYEGAGVSYWASPIEAKLCEGEDVVLVGGGNSAGQAVAFLAPKVRYLDLVVRGPGLEATMSRYLIDRIAALPNVKLHRRTEVTGLEGDRNQGLTGCTLRDRETGREWQQTIRHLFLFVGADPNTDWLEGCVERDGKGFIRTGFESQGRKPHSPPVCSRPAGRGSLPSAMSAPAQPSGLPPLSARALRWSPRSMACWPIGSSSPRAMAAAKASSGANSTSSA